MDAIISNAQSSRLRASPLEKLTARMRLKIAIEKEEEMMFFDD